MQKVQLHSSVDVITNSSTVIYTYQNSIEQAKELVQAVLDLQGLPDVTPDDVFYYGIFCDSYEGPKEAPQINWRADIENRRFQQQLREEWFRDLKLSIMKGEQDKPAWMIAEENGGDWDNWTPSTYLHLEPKDEKYSDLADKICSLLNSVSADGGRDG
jgi:hypothetical protein